MNTLKLALVQTRLEWENSEANHTQLGKKLSTIPNVDIIFLPEMWPTGFSMKPEEFAETMDGPSVEFMKSQAQRLNAVVTGSVIIKENGQYFNRLIWAQPEGDIKHYDKRHRFTYAGEHKSYTAGNARPTWEYKGWKIRPQVCYDLRFPVWSRNDDNYDLLFYVANWPERRSYPWKSLLIARAIENMSFVVGLNRVGEDGNGIAHSGDSMVLDPLGELIVSAKPHDEEIVLAEVSKNDLHTARDRFHFLDDRDSFEVKE